MKNILIILIISIFSITSLNAEVANNLIIKGNKRVSDETVKIYGEISIGKNYSDNDLDDILKNLYSTNFFENVSVNLINNTPIFCSRELMVTLLVVEKGDVIPPFLLYFII